MPSSRLMSAFSTEKRFFFFSPSRFPRDLLGLAADLRGPATRGRFLAAGFPPREWTSFFVATPDSPPTRFFDLSRNDGLSNRGHPSTIAIAYRPYFCRIFSPPAHFSFLSFSSTLFLRTDPAWKTFLDARVHSDPWPRFDSPAFLPLPSSDTHSQSGPWFARRDRRLRMRRNLPRGLARFSPPAHILFFPARLLKIFPASLRDSR